MIYDRRNRENINKLAINTRKKALVWYEFCVKNNIEILIYETIRTKEKQRENVNKGASQTMKSYHLVGQALDFVPVNSKGKTLWNGYNADDIRKAINYARQLGFTWGGDWKSFVDKPHLQYEHNGYGTDVFKEVESSKQITFGIEELVKKTLRGDFGNGETRKKLLGSKYNLQNIFNLERLFTKTSIKDEVAAAIVQACDYFSKTKTGALIVLSQNSELYNYAQTGVLIRSIVSEELLENIFFKNSPLHDGAVIIADNKILAARCILPVSDNTNIPGSLGLRHRAAIGMSAVTDAHIIVVSEETGNISFVKDGHFKVRITPQELNSFLHNDFTGFVVNK